MTTAVPRKTRAKAPPTNVVPTIDEAVAAVYAAPHTHPVLELPIAAIQPSAENPRIDFDEKELAQLARSLKEHGQIEPIVVRSMGLIGASGKSFEHYELIAGERRWRAAGIAGLKTLTAVVRNDLDARGARALRLIENLQRVQLNPLEEARGVAALQETLNLTQSQVAATIGRSQPMIARRLALLKLPADVQGYIERGTLTQSHADVMANLVPFPAVLSRIAHLAASQAWPVSAIEKLDGEVWERLETEQLVRRISHTMPFKDTICAACPFNARRTGRWGNLFCLAPEHYDELKADADRQRAAEREAAQAAVAAATATASLPLIAELSGAVYRRIGGLYSTVPPTCTEACPCRAAAIDHTGDVVPICSDPNRFNALIEEQNHVKAVLNNAVVQRRRDQLAALLPVDYVTGAPARRGLATVVHHLITRTNDPAAGRDACKTYADMTWRKKDKGPALDALAQLPVSTLVTLAIATLIGKELNARAQWGNSPLDYTPWFLGPDLAASDSLTSATAAENGESPPPDAQPPAAAPADEDMAEHICGMCDDLFWADGDVQRLPNGDPLCPECEEAHAPGQSDG